MFLKNLEKQSYHWRRSVYVHPPLRGIRTSGPPSKFLAIILLCLPTTPVPASSLEALGDLRSAHTRAKPANQRISGHCFPHMTPLLRIFPIDIHCVDWPKSAWSSASPCARFSVSSWGGVAWDTRMFPRALPLLKGSDDTSGGSEGCVCRGPSQLLETPPRECRAKEADQLYRMLGGRLPGLHRANQCPHATTPIATRCVSRSAKYYCSIPPRPEFASPWIG